MKNKKLIVTILIVLSCFLTSPSALAREKGSAATQELPVDLRFNQRYTTHNIEAPAPTPEPAYTSPELVDPPHQEQPAAEPAADPTPEPAAEPAADPTPAPAADPAPAPVTVNVLNILGTVIPFQNGGMANGQAIIDGNPNGMASTWGGATPYSGTDGLNTHFIGHHWGVFDPVLSLGTGGVITVNGADGTAYNYTIYKIAVVDTSGRDTTTGASLYGEITSLGGGERIVLQTCIDDTTRRIVFAA